MKKLAFGKKTKNVTIQRISGEPLAPYKCMFSLKEVARCFFIGWDETNQSIIFWHFPTAHISYSIFTSRVVFFNFDQTTRILR